MEGRVEQSSLVRGGYRDETIEIFLTLGRFCLDQYELLNLPKINVPSLVPS